MTREELHACEPVLAALKAAGVVESYAFTSRPWDRGVYVWCVHFVRATGLPFIFDEPFTESDVRDREALAYSRQQHSAAIEATLAQVKDAIIRDLAAVHRLQLLGKDVPIPNPVILSRVVIPLTDTAATFPVTTTP